MINANELRIGNFVNDVGSQPFQIRPINIADALYAEEKGKHHLGINAIPITDDWLTKLGFHMFQEFEDGSIANWERGKMSIPQSDLFNIWWQGDYLGITIKFVHQLQNIYFALTDEELFI